MMVSTREMPIWHYIVLVAVALFALVVVCGCNVIERENILPEQPAASMPPSTSDVQSTGSGEQWSLPYNSKEESAAPDGLEMNTYWAGDADGVYWDDKSEHFDPFSTEEYSSINEGGFVSTANRPLSTFSADVDTASYCNLRRMIEDGYGIEDIPRGAIRIEEMLNYFTYDYALPQGADLFGTTVQVAECPWNKDTKLAVFGFATSPELKENRGSNLVFLIDVSGSMGSPDKLDLLQEAFAVLVDELDENDRVSIVAYASGEELVLDGAAGSDSRKIMRAINRLHAEGSTNGEAGLRMAYEVAQRHYIDSGVNRIILASDGDLNVGMTDESSLEAYVAKQRDTGIYLSVLGFGSGNYKDNKMEALADNGNGNYHYVDCLAEAERVFGEHLTANLVPLADDVKLQVEFNPAQVKAYRLIGYENRALADEDFRDDTKDAGEVGPGHQFSVAYEIALTSSDLEVNTTTLKYSVDSEREVEAATSDEWLTCSMRYRLANEEKYTEQSFTVDAGHLTNKPSADWQFAAAVIEAGMVLRDSEYAGGAELDDILDLLDGIDGLESDDLRAEFYDLIDAVAGDQVLSWH